MTRPAYCPRHTHNWRHNRQKVRTTFHIPKILTNSTMHKQGVDSPASCLRSASQNPAHHPAQGRPEEPCLGPGRSARC